MIKVKEIKKTISNHLFGKSKPNSVDRALRQYFPCVAERATYKNQVVHFYYEQIKDSIEDLMDEMEQGQGENQDQDQDQSGDQGGDQDQDQDQDQSGDQEADEEDPQDEQSTLEKAIGWLLDDETSERKEEQMVIVMSELPSPLKYDRNLFDLFKLFKAYDFDVKGITQKVKRRNQKRYPLPSKLTTTEKAYNRISKRLKISRNENGRSFIDKVDASRPLHIIVDKSGSMQFNKLKHPYGYSTRHDFATALLIAVHNNREALEKTHYYAFTDVIEEMEYTQLLHRPSDGGTEIEDLNQFLKAYKKDLFIVISDGEIPDLDTIKSDNVIMLVIDDKFTSPLKHWQAHIDGTFNGFDRAVRKLKAIIKR